VAADVGKIDIEGLAGHFGLQPRVSDEEDFSYAFWLPCLSTRPAAPTSRTDRLVTNLSPRPAGRR
jgi:hypothetical protein